jgi:hypothetical protein
LVVNTSGITIVAPPPSGGEKRAAPMRAKQHWTTLGDRPSTAEGTALLTWPSAAILAVTRTVPRMFGSSFKPLL